MSNEFINLFSIMMAIMIPVGVGGGVVILMASLGKRLSKRRIPSPESSEDLGGVLDALERMELRLQQVEERVDFIERVLPAMREAKLISELPAPPVDRTPR